MWLRPSFRAWYNTLASCEWPTPAHCSGSQLPVQPKSSLTCWQWSLVFHNRQENTAVSLAKRADLQVIQSSGASWTSRCLFSSVRDLAKDPRHEGWRANFQVWLKGAVFLSCRSVGGFRTPLSSRFSTAGNPATGALTWAAGGTGLGQVQVPVRTWIALRQHPACKQSKVPFPGDHALQIRCIGLNVEAWCLRPMDPWQDQMHDPAVPRPALWALRSLGCSSN